MKEAAWAVNSCTRERAQWAVPAGVRVQCQPAGHTRAHLLIFVELYSHACVRVCFNAYERTLEAKIEWAWHRRRRRAMCARNSTPGRRALVVGLPHLSLNLRPLLLITYPQGGTSARVRHKRGSHLSKLGCDCRPLLSDWALGSTG
uniref:Transposase n=1 Tax=Mesocestoides corti TaxID=53468 RepID=A0A5K3EZH3_MESCO